MAEESENKIGQLQLLEQNLQNFLVQKQGFQGQLSEIDSALEELKGAKNAYKIVGNIMVASEKEELEKDLKQKKEELELRIKTLEKQEQTIKDKATKLQSEVLGEMKEKKWRRMTSKLEEVVEALSELKEDSTIPRNIKVKIDAEITR